MTVNYGIFIGALVGVAAAALIALPVAAADPGCTTVGQSASQQVQSYLDRHPDMRQNLTNRAQAETPGNPNALVEYLNRHPDVRQHIVDLANHCT